MKKITRFKNSLTVRFILCLILVMMVPFSILLMLTSRNIAENEYEQECETLENSLDVIALTMDHRLSAIETLSNTLLTDAEFTEHVTDLTVYRHPMSYEDYLHIKGIKSAISSLVFRNDDIKNLYLYSTSTHRFFNTSVNWDPSYNNLYLHDTIWYQTYQNMVNGNSWQITTSPIDQEKIVSLYRTIKKPKNRIGAVYSVNISENTIVDIIKSANSYNTDSFCLLIDSSGNIISTETLSQNFLSAIYAAISAYQTERTTTINFEDETYYLTYQNSDQSGFGYILGINQDDIPSSSSSIRNLLNAYLINALLAIFICILLAYVFFLKPIGRLSSGMHKSQAGDFSARLPEHSNDEIGQINHRFNRMNQSLEELINENYIKELEKRTMELKLLGNQINEHFLYNTLDSIHWLARKNGDHMVSQSIRHLTDFYRISLSYGSDTISIEELKQMLESYLFLQQMRHMDHMQYEISIDEKFMAYSVPKYLFIPLIENAVMHGIRNISDGVVCVSLYKQEDAIRFQVTDNGIGISKERLQEIRLGLNQADFNNSDCYALKNLNRQLALHYKDSSGVHIESTEGYGTVVWFVIPLKGEDSK